ncbi:MAG: hypothetical protein PHE24_03725 [Patescibacteria group bacterium]|nr:hypothetical protein [Patescibacteria group bacterium]
MSNLAVVLAIVCVFLYTIVVNTKLGEIKKARIAIGVLAVIAGGSVLFTHVWYLCFVYFLMGIVNFILAKRLTAAH